MLLSSGFDDDSRSCDDSNDRASPFSKGSVNSLELYKFSKDTPKFWGKPPIHTHFNPKIILPLAGRESELYVNDGTCVLLANVLFTFSADNLLVICK